MVNGLMVLEYRATELEIQGLQSTQDIKGYRIWNITAIIDVKYRGSAGHVIQIWNTEAGGHGIQGALMNI
jgi:hypothetical protein